MQNCKLEREVENRAELEKYAKGRRFALDCSVIEEEEQEQEEQKQDKEVRSGSTIPPPHSATCGLHL
jgi:hypothetical protein